MSLQERFAKFEKVFPTLGIKFDEWKKLKQWNDTNPITDKLDLSIFPDSLTTLEWVSGAVRTLIIPESMSKLTGLNLACNHLDKLVLPETVKLKSLDIGYNPLKKFKLGGSIDTLEHLSLPTEMPVEKVRFPAGLTKLKSLEVGSVVGSVALPKDMIALEELELAIRPADGKVKIPAELVNLNTLNVFGAIRTLTISPKAEKLEKLIIETATSELTLPRSLPGLKSLRVQASSTKSITVPNALGLTLTELHIDGYDATEVVLPKAPEHLTDLFVYAPNADVTVPAKAINLEETVVTGLNITYAAKSPNLRGLRLTAEQDAVVKTAQSFEVIESLHLFVAGDTEIKLPQSMPKLASLAVPTGIIPEGAEYADKAIRSGKI